MWGSSVLNIQMELEVEKRANGELRSIVNTQREQMDDLSQQVKETDAARIID
jgi:antitoxin component of MazEF toxin-antitoxin module